MRIQKSQGLAFVFAIMLLIVGCDLQPARIIAPTSTPTSNPTLVSSCLISYPEVWHIVVNPQVQKVTDGVLLEEINAVIDSPCPTRCPLIYAVQHPDDKETIFIEAEYEPQSGEHGHVATVLLRRTGKEWTRLQNPHYQSTPWVMVLDIDLIGFARECGTWILYVGVRNTEYQLGSGALKDTTFYRSWDNGGSWEKLTSYGNAYWVPPVPPILPPDDSILATGFYNIEQELLTTFAWTKDDRALYAFTYPATPTPQPATPTPYLSPKATRMP
jgi:hypothetical protein